jgi:hypothetical protein
MQPYAAAAAHIVRELAGKPVPIFVIWEPVLAMDWSSPSAAAPGRISDSRAAQFWDKGRLISHSMGEPDRRCVVWDYIAVYPPGAVWEDRHPEALYHGGPVVSVTKPARAALAQAFKRGRGKGTPLRQTG